MKYGMLASAVVAAGVMQAASLGAGSPAAQGQTSSSGATKWTVARTTWGDPDLQGKWAVAETGTAMERPREFGDHQFLTDKELADRIASLSKRAPANDSDDAAFPEIKKTAPAHEKGIRGEEYNRFWVEDRKSTRLNSSHIQKSRMPSSA